MNRPSLLTPQGDFQKRLDAAMTELQRSNRELTSHPQKVDAALENLENNVEFLFHDYEDWLHRQGLDRRASILFVRGNAVLLMGRLREAQQIFQRTLDFLSNEPIPNARRCSLLSGLGLVYLQQGYFDEARHSFQRGYDEGRVLAETYEQLAQDTSGTTSQQRSLYEKMAALAWQEAAHRLSQIGVCALIQEDRAGFTTFFQEAEALAQTHGLSDFSSQLRYDELKWRFYSDSDSAGEFTEELSEKLHKEMQKVQDNAQLHIGLTLLEVELIISMRSQMTKSFVQSVLSELEEAEQRAITNDLPASQRLVILAKIGVLEADQQIDEAIKQAENLLQVSQKMGISPDFEAQSVLIRMRLKSGYGKSSDVAQQRQADHEIEELRNNGNNQYLAQVLRERALFYIKQKRFEDALQDIEQAERCASEAYERKQLLFEKFVLLLELGRTSEALVQGKEAITRYSEALLPPNRQLQAQWKDVLGRLGSLYTAMARLLVDMGQPDHLQQAFAMAEQGKAQILRQQLVWSGEQPDQAQAASSEIDFDQLRATLASESAALVMFSLGGTLSDDDNDAMKEKRPWMFIVDPRYQEPRYCLLDKSVISILREYTSAPDSKLARMQLFNKILPELSKHLLPPLREVVQNCKVLYLVPSSLLYRIPFAALSFGDGTYLIEHCALTYVPSIATLYWCRSRYRSVAEHTCLALGVGTYPKSPLAGQSVISFADQAREIAALPWAAQDNPLPETIISSEVLTKMQNFTVIHLSCHGGVDNRANILLASSLELHDKLTAKQIFDLNGSLNAELVFLNACVSARFQQSMENEVGGFLQAFLQAGTASLIATLVEVEPNSSHQLALNFYKNWLQGAVTKAEALQKAQIKLLKEVKNDGSKLYKPYQWASHILIGDHR